MSGQRDFRQYETVPETMVTLTEVCDTVKGNYPIIVRVVPNKYELWNMKQLPRDVEMLLEKPKVIHFALVRILSFPDGDRARRQKGDVFVEERNSYVGKKFLIPICYPGKIKLINKPGRHSRYASIAEAIQHLPRFIRLNQETPYTLPRQSCVTSPVYIAAGTTLEIRSIYSPVSGMARYAKCTSTTSARKYEFRDDCPIKCTAIDDPSEHTLHKLVTSVLLPKNIQFQNVCTDDVVLMDNEEAKAMLILTGGPMKVLKIVNRDVLIVRIKSGRHSRKTVAVVPKESWCNQLVQIETYANESEKREYINEHFGESLDATFLRKGLYIMRPIEKGVVWLAAPQVSNKAHKPLETTDKLPFPVPLEHWMEDVLQRIKEKIRLGFDKVHAQLLTRDQTKHVKTAKHIHKTRLPVAGPKSEPISEFKQSNTDKQELSRSFNLRQRLTEDEEACSRKLCRAYLRNKNRLLPDLPPFQELLTENISNKTVGDTLHIYDHVKDEAFFKMSAVAEREEKTSFKNNTLSYLPDGNKFGQPDQSNDDIYSYSVDELVVCLNMCGLGKFAIDCNTHKLDGAFFRNFDLNVLKTEPVSLNKTDLLNFRKLIRDGWRPKSDTEMHQVQV